MVLFAMATSYCINAQSTIFEAEDFSLSGQAQIYDDASLSGGKYVDTKDGDMSYTFTLQDDAYFDIYLYVASPNGEKYNDFVIDGNSASFGFDAASPYVKLKVGSFMKLLQGDHTIEIKRSWGYISIDYIELQKVDPSDRFNVTPTLCTPNPTDEAQRLYQFLLDNYGKKIICGAMTLKNMDMIATLKAHTGKEPALAGIDFLFENQGYSWYGDGTVAKDAEAWYNRNGIPALCWHWTDPSTNQGSFYYRSTNYPNGTTFDANNVFKTGTAEYDSIISDMDYIAGQLKVLQDKGVPIIWRPLHEASGGWFWWGAQGPAPLKELWHIMYDRFVNYHGLKNLIWVWTQQAGESSDWYPGDEYVDIIGMDIYKTGDHTSQIMEFNNVNNVHNGEKIVAETECGSFPDPDNLVADGAAWSWFMPWYDSQGYEFLTGETYNPASFWAKVVDHDYVIMLEDMPNLKAYVSTPADNAQLKNAHVETGIMQPAFDPDTLAYTIYVPSTATTPALSATTVDDNAKFTITQSPSNSGTASILVTSRDGSATQTYTFTFIEYTPVATTITIAPKELSILTEETATISAHVLDQYDGAMDNATIEWTSTAGSITSSDDTSAVYTPNGAGTCTITAKSNGISNTATAITKAGTSIPNPLASNWEVFNTWDNQSNGSGVSDGTEALTINHVQWGYGELWLVNSGVDISLEKDVEYDIIFQYKDDALASVTEIEFGFAATWNASTVTTYSSSVASSSNFSTSNFFTTNSTVTATETVSGHLFLKLSWGTDPTNDKPTQAYTSYLKGIKIVPRQETQTQTIVLKSGWNLASTHITATDNSIEAIFPCADKVKDDDNFFSSELPYYLNGVTEISTDKGYLVYSPSGCIASITGQTATPASVFLAKGWNLIGYPLDTQTDVETALSGIISKVESIKNFDYFWKSGINGGLETLDPGKAYFIYVSEPCTIVW